MYEAVTAAFDCGGHTFTAKGRRILSEGWREIDRIFRASLKEHGRTRRSPSPCRISPKARPLTRWMPLLPNTSPPRPSVHGGHPSGGDGDRRKRRYAGGRRAQGPGHPGDQGGDPGKAGGGRICGAQRQKPGSTKAGINLVTVLPDTLTSPMLTAEWEQKLTAIARGEGDPTAFMAGISEMTRELVKTYSHISEEGQKLFAPERETVGLCPAAANRSMRAKRIFTAPTAPAASCCGRMTASGPPAKRS